MSKVVHCAQFIGDQGDKETADEAVSISLMETGNVHVQFAKNGTILTYATILKADWSVMLEKFSGVKNGNDD